MALYLYACKVTSKSLSKPKHGLACQTVWGQPKKNSLATVAWIPGMKLDYIKYFKLRQGWRNNHYGRLHVQCRGNCIHNTSIYHYWKPFSRIFQCNNRYKTYSQVWLTLINACECRPLVNKELQLTALWNTVTDSTLPSKRIPRRIWLITVLSCHKTHEEIWLALPKFWQWSQNNASTHSGMQD